MSHLQILERGLLQSHWLCSRTAEQTHFFPPPASKTRAVKCTPEQQVAIYHLYCSEVKTRKDTTTTTTGGENHLCGLTAEFLLSVTLEYKVNKIQENDNCESLLIKVRRYPRSFPPAAPL